jgi:hypothetical protein
MAGCAILSAIGGAAAITSLLHLNTAGVVYVNVVPPSDRAGAADLVATIHSDVLFHGIVGIAGLVALTLLSLAVRRPHQHPRGHPARRDLRVLSASAAYDIRRVLSLAT